MTEDERAALDREHERLVGEQKLLLLEHQELEERPFDIVAHREHSRKLRAHIAALHAHLRALRDRPA